MVPFGDTQHHSIEADKTTGDKKPFCRSRVKRFRWFAAGPDAKSALARKPTGFQRLIR